MRISLSASLFVKGTSLSFAKRNVSCAYLISLFNKLRARVRLTLPFLALPLLTLISGHSCLPDSTENYPKF